MQELVFISSYIEIQISTEFQGKNIVYLSPEA